MYKIISVFSLVISQLAFSAVEYPQITDSSSEGIKNRMFNNLRQASSYTGEELALNKATPETWTQAREGTVAYWEVLDKNTNEVVDQFYSRNGRVPNQTLKSPENLNALTQEQRTRFARFNPNSKIQQDVVVGDANRKFDAEIKAIHRVERNVNNFGYKNKAGKTLTQADIKLRGMIDKSSCVACQQSLAKAEGKVASKIQVYTPQDGTEIKAKIRTARIDELEAAESGQGSITKGAVCE
ncbi:hypothetical protein [Spartinivicinus ruber]|uniref:hypothetical protein n=1 Tax=Spartinivicinus ruber TaxID=2683272 RepID=UPI0013D4C8C1|nr:hypothetical protein [Spartinivicinus ruber]